MGFFDFWRRKTEKKAAETDDTTQLKRLESSIRRQRNEIYRRKLEQLKEKQERMLLEQDIADAEEQLNEFIDDDDDDEDGAPTANFNNPDALISTLLTQFVLKQVASKGGALSPPTPPPTPTPPQELKIKYTDQQIQDIKSKIPNHYIKELKKMDEDELISFIMEKYPTLDDDTIKRAAVILRA